MVMKATLLIIVHRESHESDSAKTSGIHSRPTSQNYSDGWERIFGKKEPTPDKANLN
jgi:hypothetical protein